MNDKPEMFHNKIKKEINNNKVIYTSYNKKEDSVKWSTNDIRKKVDDIVNSDSFIYSKLVNVVIDNNIIKKKIIGIYNNNLITIDNEYIPLDIITDIYI